MTCPNCGSENTPGAKFCFRCGASLTAATPAASVEPAPEPVQTSSPGYPEPSAPAGGVTATETPQPTYSQSAPSQPAAGANGWQTSSAPQAPQFTLPTAPPWLDRFDRQLCAAGPAFNGITRPLAAATTPLAVVGKLIAAGVGAILLVLGTFLPTESVLSLSWNYWFPFRFTAIVLLVLAAVSVLSALFQLHALLWVAWTLSFVLVLTTWLDQAIGPGFEGVSMSWGWIIMWLGVIVLLIAAAMPETANTWISQRMAQQPGAQP
jgi:hypothetical protein